MFDVMRLLKGRRNRLIGSYIPETHGYLFYPYPDIIEDILGRNFKVFSTL